MAIKLGELLLNEKLITPAQLDEALKNQTIFGIKLGSALIELGFISDEQLCTLLSQKLGVSAVPQRALSWISPEVLALVPTELAAKYRVLPLRLEGKKLALAMADPTDFKAIDEVAFVTSCVVIPYIAPEVRIAAALSKHYNIRRDDRFLRIEVELDNQRRAVSPARTDKNAEIIENPMAKITEELLNINIPRESDVFASLPGTEQEPASPVDTADRYTVDQLSLEFASATNRDQVANVFITYLGQEFRVGALFIIRNDTAVGWRGIADGKRLTELENMAIPLSRFSVMKNVIETRLYSMSRLMERPENTQLLDVLGVDYDTPLLVLPIVMMNKVVAEVIVSADKEALGARLQELQKLVYKASLAFEMLIIKNKILMT